ncbi:MAG TPA: glucans biosynthesis glucosyltransferase MdoH [Candidatus Acidoferrum sp.]|nr:glucans biosynthesis glucosyltransferase MdoH [Candidatus Acidoferrum sp.]
MTGSRTRWRTTLRQLLCSGLVALTVLLISWQAFEMLRVNGLNALKLGIFALFVVLLIPIALSFWTAAIGFVLQLAGRPALGFHRAAEGGPAWAAPLPRTAVIMPAYNEEPARVIAGLAAMYHSLEETSDLPCFDFFLLSDTNDPDVWVREEVAFAELREAVSAPERLHYRNRRENVERKTGNIGEFCATWGERYRYMVVLDADSLMTGPSLVKLVRLMESNPQAGIIQTPPMPVNRRTLFGRLQQFAMQAYGLVFITGLNFWQGGTGNYWGHNAIIRIKPFVQHCRLPRLSGKEPLGGQILSHDFVEAAFMRRAGWRVYLATDLGGSYEEAPPSLTTYAARDRRWCQGNLQHTRLLLTPGLRITSRVHLSLGVMAYLSSPLWLLLLVLSTIEGLRETLSPHAFFLPQRHMLFPNWQISISQQAILLFSIVMALLLLPKVFCLLINFRDRARVAQFGGWGRLSASVLLEMVFSTLLAPVLALLQTRFVLTTLLGRKVRWDAQERGEAGTSLGEALRRHRLSTTLGLLWGAVLLYAAPGLFWWFLPVLAGLLVSVPFSAWTSRTAVGQWFRSHGLFLTPEELGPPEILKRFSQELERAAGRPWASPRDGLAWVLDDPKVRNLHLSLLVPPLQAADPLQRHHLEGLALKLVHVGLHALTTSEKRELLLDPDLIRSLRPDVIPLFLPHSAPHGVAEPGSAAAS